MTTTHSCVTLPLTRKTQPPLLLHNLATDCLPRICLCGHSFTNTPPSNGCTCNNTFYLSFTGWNFLQYVYFNNKTALRLTSSCKFRFSITVKKVLKSFAVVSGSFTFSLFIRRDSICSVRCNSPISWSDDSVKSTVMLPFSLFITVLDFAKLHVICSQVWITIVPAIYTYIQASFMFARQVLFLV
jgi:hypothetical protein